MAPPTTLVPVEEREVFIVKETVPGTVPAAAPGSAFPVLTMKPSDKPMMLPDESMQGSMGDIYAGIQGPLIAAVDTGGNFYGDTFGHLLYNLLGDYTVTGTAAAPAGTTNALLAVGATALPVASGGASFTNGMNLWLQDAGTPAANEVVQVNGTATATSIPITATRFAHATAMPFTNTTGPYTHVFALLNGTVGAANGAAQPPTHTLTDRTGIPLTGLAAQYSYACLSELVITGNAEKLLPWTAKVTCQTRTIPGSAVAAVNPSAVQTYPSWRSVTGIAGPASGGTQVRNVGEWQLTLSRAVKPMFTNQGTQLPYVIARGKQGAKGKQTFMPAIDESPLIALLANTQPQLQVIASNGLSGTSLVSLQIDILLAMYETSDLDDAAELFGWQVPLTAIHTATSSAGVTTTGASGGKGAVKVTLINNVPSF